MNEDKKLTPNDPVSPEVLKSFENLENAKVRVAVELLNQEQRKIQLLAAAKQIDEQHNRLFESILVERGLPPQTRTNLDVNTGVLTVLEQPDPETP